MKFWIKKVPQVLVSFRVTCHLNDDTLSNEAHQMMSQCAMPPPGNLMPCHSTAGRPLCALIPPHSVTLLFPVADTPQCLIHSQ